MPLTAFCRTCRRTVYIEVDQTPVCPVCSSPLIEASVSPEREDRDDPGG
ncbi:MAG: hypothetical protein ABR529_15040 [Actinomycetota bacterium]